MIEKITNTKNLRDVYFEDIDATVDTKKECYLVESFLLLYFSTLKSAESYAARRGLELTVVEHNRKTRRYLRSK